MHPRAVLALSGTLSTALCCAALLGCRGSDAPAPPPAASGAANPSIDRPRGPALAEVPNVGLVAVPAAAPELRVARGALTLGDTTIALDGFAAPTRAGGYLVPPLFDALQSLYDTRRGVERLDPEAAGRLLLSIAPDVPYRLVTQVIYSAGQAQFADLAARVRTADGERAIALDVPRIRVARAGEPEEWSCGDTCSSAETTVHAAGVRVVARQSTGGDGLELVVLGKRLDGVFDDESRRGLGALLGDGSSHGLADAFAEGVGVGDGPGRRGVEPRRGSTAENGTGSPPGAGRGRARSIRTDGASRSALAALGGREPVDGPTKEAPEAAVKAPARADASPPPEPALDWRDALMLSAADVCPSVPRASGRVDRAALRALLMRVYALEPGCVRAMVGADPTLPWQDVADALQVHRALEHVPVLFAGEPHPDPLDCAGGLVPPAAEAP